MEFLYKLYDLEYFGIGIFIIITFLTFLFLIILFFGKKDEKQRKIEETKEMGLNDFVSEHADLKDNSIPEIEQPVIENINEEVQNFENSVEAPVETEEIEEQEVKQPTLSDIDIDALFQTGLEANEETVAEPSAEEIVEPEQPEVPEIEEPVVENANIFDEPKEESNVFEDVKEEQTIEEPKTVNPMFELPKKAEPNVEKDENKSDLESSVNKVSDFDSLFGNIESETYNIKK